MVAGDEFLACANDTFFFFPVIPATTVGINLYKQSAGLVAGLSPPIAGFDPRSVRVGFVVYKLILGATSSSSVFFVQCHFTNDAFQSPTTDTTYS
jgi:hypothetical protein